MKINKNKFWEYAYSNFLDNRNRGALAEYIVAEALGIKEIPSTSWESYDMETSDGIKVEIKTSAYVQAWKQEKLSSPSFGIAKKQGWVGDTNEWDGKHTRHADVYIFCLLHHKDKETADPLNPTQWTFYLVRTSLLNLELPEGKSIGLSTLQTLEHNKCSYYELKEKFNQIKEVL